MYRARCNRSVEGGMSEWDPPAGVGRTALGVAHVRAGESRRPDRLFEDPYAQAFLDAAPGSLPTDAGEVKDLPPAMATLGAVFAWHGVIRTRFFDDYLIAAGRAGCQQVVLLAAGLDTRAFRLDWPAGTTLFEVDLPEVIEFKERVLTSRSARSRCHRTVIAADLRGSWVQPLTAAGFDPARRTAWLVEGLLIYLSADDATRLLTEITRLSAPGSRLSFEHGSIAKSPVLARAKQLPSMQEYTAMWEGGLGMDAPVWLAEHGWRVQTHDAAAVAESYQRPAPAAGSGGFITATVDTSGP
jgi:methyltransferase (TIGR00027 family)